MNTARRQSKFAQWGMVLLTLVLLVAPFAVSAQNYHLKDQVTERCSTTVHIVPHYQDDDGPINPPGTVVLQRNSHGVSDWSNVMVLTYHPDGNVTWYCGTTRENTTCPDETVAVKARLGLWRALLIDCLA